MNKRQMELVLVNEIQKENTHKKQKKITSSCVSTIYINDSITNSINKEKLTEIFTNCGIINFFNYLGKIELKLLAKKIIGVQNEIKLY